VVYEGRFAAILNEKEDFPPQLAAAEKAETHMGSVVKKRRKKIRKHKYKKLRKRMRHQRRK
jgi:hypothetical protein